MKKLMLFFFFTSFCVVAQRKVYTNDDFKRIISSSKAQEETYPVLIDKAIRDKSSTVTIQTDMRAVLYDFIKFALKKDIHFNSFTGNYVLPFTIFAKPSGEIEYFVYGLDRSFINRMVRVNSRVIIDSLNVSEKKIFEQVAEEFVQNYKLPANTSANNFSINSSISIGKETRRVSKYYISSLELAQECNLPDTVKVLNLNKLYLETFPEIAFKFKNLEKLDVADNYFTEVPEAIWDLKKLRFLNLSGNRIDFEKFRFKRNKHIKDLNLQYTGINEIPRSIRKNKNLELLFLGNNRIIQFRRSDFSGLSKLKVLNLYNVRTTTLPKNIKKLKSLEELDLYYNELQFLPKEICKLSNLKTLALSNNQLWKLPEGLGSMKNLRTLYVHHNKLNFLPDLPELKLLDIGYNLFKVFPQQVYTVQSLEEFDITKNQIAEVPMKLTALEKLQKVYLSGNEFNRDEEKTQELSKLVADLEKKDILVRK